MRAGGKGLPHKLPIQSTCETETETKTESETQRRSRRLRTATDIDATEDYIYLSERQKTSRVPGELWPSSTEESYGGGEGWQRAMAASYGGDR
ncbi:unnamed protein product [Camellia sinensis]